jgi:hypothetical protein
VALGLVVELLVTLFEGVAPEDEELPELHAAAVRTTAAAPARQAVRFDKSRIFTAFTYS